MSELGVCPKCGNPRRPFDGLIRCVGDFCERDCLEKNRADSVISGKGPAPLSAKAKLLKPKEATAHP